MKQNTDTWTEEMLKKHGWYAHYVFDDTDYPYNVNIHTHGLNQYKQHPDIQICFPLAKETAHGILISIAEEIKNGKRFTTGVRFGEIIKNYDIEFASAQESERNVLRIIFPDKNGDLHGEYKKQWEGCKLNAKNN